MKYKVIDYRNLVTLWYNEFLPERIGQNKSVFVEDAGILYLRAIPLEPIRKDTIKFMCKKLVGMVECSDIGWVVQGPKPVNNVRIQPLLGFLDEMKDISQERKDKVLHFANRRYVPMSSNIMVSQDKEIDDFLDGVFKDMCKMDVPNIRLYPIQSLGVSDFIDSAKEFLPKKSLSIQSEIQGEHIQVRSTNEMLEQLKSYVVNADLGNHNNLGFIERCKDSISRDLCELV